MIEMIENAVQLIVLGFCAVIAFTRAMSTRERAWLLLGFFYAVFFLGDLYWLFYLIFYGGTPSYSFIPYLSWDASYLFLGLLLQYQQVLVSWKKNIWILLCTLVFTVGMCLYYMSFGSYLSNLITTILMSILIWCSLSGLMAGRKSPGTAAKASLPGSRMTRPDVSGAVNRNRDLCVGILFFCMIEYAMWTVTCILDMPYFYIYYVLDVLLMVAAALLIPAVRKAVDR